MIALEYNLSRPFPGRRFTPAVFVGAVLVVIALTVLNSTWLMISVHGDTF
jgi:hypothetical protein